MALRRTNELEDDEANYWRNERGCVGSNLFGAEAAPKALGELRAAEAGLRGGGPSGAPPDDSLSETGSSAAIVLDEPLPPPPPKAPAPPSLAPSTPPRGASIASLSPQLPRKASATTPSICSSSSLGDESRRPAASSSATPRGDFSQAEYVRLESEFRKLRHKFAALRAERYQAPDVRESVQRLLKGQPAILSLYRSRREKQELLKAALASGDGNTLVTVVLYLRESLSMPLFQETLLKHPPAANHYIVYLREAEKFEELRTVLAWVGRREEAAMVDVRLALRHTNATSKIAALNKAISAGPMAAEASLVADIRLLQDYIKLLEAQIPVEEADAKSAREGREGKWRVYPRASSLIDQPVLTSLYYSCLYHYDLPANSFAAPTYLKAEQRLTEKEFAWVAVRSLARQHRWPQIQTLLTAPSLQIGAKFSIGAKRIRSPIPWEELLSTLAKHSAPIDILALFLADVPDSEERLGLAKKHKVHKVAVDCFVAAKDRQGLMDYNARHITQHTPESLYANGAMANSSIRWKN